MPAATAEASVVDSCRRSGGTAMAPLLRRVTCSACEWEPMPGLRTTREESEREESSSASSCACMLCLWRAV
jgi:hypothetical protein